jgi:hypothetical protein
MSNFFSYFPTMLYEQNGQNIEVTDITKRFIYIDYLRSISAIYYDYIVEEGDRPDIIADKLYGDSNLDWLIMLVNQVFDADFDFYMSYEKFMPYLVAKYGSVENATQTIHHYEWIINEASMDQYGTEVYEKVVNVDLTFYNTLVADTRREVSCYDYEKNLNEERKIIILPRPSYIPQILRELKTIFQQNVI